MYDLPGATFVFNEVFNEYLKLVELPELLFTILPKLCSVNQTVQYSIFYLFIKLMLSIRWENPNHPRLLPMPLKLCSFPEVQVLKNNNVHAKTTVRIACSNQKVFV